MNATEKTDVVIIGSGIGGLCAALCLAKAGKKVCVLEQHYVPGGWCHSFTLNGQRFSPGVHYIGSLEEDASTTRLLQGLGVAGDMVFFRINNKGFERALVGKDYITLGIGYETVYNELSAKFPNEKKGIRKILSLIKEINEGINVVSNSKGPGYLLLPFKARYILTHGFFKLKTILDRYIKDPLLKDVLAMQCGDHGLAPSEVSFLCHASLMGHYINGGYYPEGGGAGLVKVMTNAIKRHGGEIRTSTMVKEIMIAENGVKKAVGVKLEDGTEIAADQIISNTDPHKTYLEMIGEKHLSAGLKRRVKSTTYSYGSLIMFLTLDVDVKKYGLDSGNIWMSEKQDLDAQYKKIKNVSLSDEKEFPCLFISCSTLKDPLSFNGRYYNFELVTFADYSVFEKFKGFEKYQSESYLEYKKTVCNKFLNSLRKIIPDVEKHIIQMEIGTPKTNEHYINCTRANVYGTEKTLRQILFPFTAKSEIKNLYLCGASTTSHGVTGAGYSGVNAAAAILGVKADDLLEQQGKKDPLAIYDAEDSTSWPEWIQRKIELRKNRFKEVRPSPFNSYTTADDPGNLRNKKQQSRPDDNSALGSRAA